MFKITKDGATVAMTEAPNYIKQAENGCFVLCPEAEATGIAHNGTVYTSWDALTWRGQKCTVMLEETDAGVEICQGGSTLRGSCSSQWRRPEAWTPQRRRNTPDLFAPWAVPGGLYRGPDPQIYGREAV